MSSAPPNTPPGGMPPYPPYDPKTQWRIYREQQKAAWRAQRESWKAQRHAWKASCRGAYALRAPSLVGPIILVAIGVVGLLIYSGRISGQQFWSWYGHWWPLLLIGAGLALLGEWALDLHRSAPVHRGGGFVGVIVLLAIVGIFAAGWNSMEPWFGGWNHNGNGFFNFFGPPEHDQDQQPLSAPIPARAVIDIENPRGDVNVTAGGGSEIQVQAHEVAYANSVPAAQKIFDAEKATVTVNGNAVLVKASAGEDGRVNLAVTVPPAATVAVNTDRGDVAVAGLGNGVTVDAPHGDTQLNTITGPVVVHLAHGGHDFSAHQVNGSIAADGNCSDLTISEIRGSFVQNGEIFGDVHIEDVSGQVHLHTSITEVDLASLPGDLTLDSGDLRVVEAKGAVQVATHAKDVDLSQIYGDTSVQDRDGRISIEPAGSYSIDARNGRGDVEITLPPDASATVNGRTHDGDIVTDYGLAVTGGANKTVSGRIGSGHAKIYLSADNGDLRIQKGPAFPPSPPSPAQSGAWPPPPPNARHLKTSRALPPQPVTQ